MKSMDTKDIPFERRVSLMIALEKALNERRKCQPDSDFWLMRRDFEDELEQLSKGEI